MKHVWFKYLQNKAQFMHFEASPLGELTVVSGVVRGFSSNHSPIWNKMVIHMHYIYMQTKEKFWNSELLEKILWQKDGFWIASKVYSKVVCV